MTTTQEAPEVTLETLQAEIERLKAQRRTERKSIVDIARRYAEQHNLCSVVDQALGEAGLLGGDKTIQVDMNMPVRIVFGVDETTTEEEAVELVKSQISLAPTPNIRLNGLGAITSIANGRIRRQDPTVSKNGDPEIVAVSTVDLSDTTRLAGDGVYAAWAQAPHGYLALYVGHEGRKLHFVEAAHTGQRVIIDGIDFFVSQYAMCGNLAYNWRLTSPRGNSRGTAQGICSRCRDRAHANHGWSFNQAEARRRR